MRILLICHSFNSLSQRLHVDLREAGHEVSVELDINDAVTSEAVALFKPDVIIAPFLKRAVPEAIWRKVTTLIVHPGPPGDRGPSALDWAILDDVKEWGVTVLQADNKLDTGPVWAWRTFPMRQATKSNLYRHEVTPAAAATVAEALNRLENGEGPLGLPGDVSVPLIGREKPLCRREDRAIDWSSDDTETVLRKIRSGDGQPGALATIGDHVYRLFGGRVANAEGLRANPGTPVSRTISGQVALATLDGALWVESLREDDPLALKLPAAVVLTPTDSLPVNDVSFDIRYVEKGEIGYLHFDFQGGALTPDQSRRLLAAYQQACTRPTKVICLMGGDDYWCNGIHLGFIEAAESPAEASWLAINAIDDLARAIINTTSHRVVAALRGNAGAGGVFLALGADVVIGHAGVILNPHYKDMGNLYGSEYWTYVLPRRAGEEQAGKVVQARLPIGMNEALKLGLVDDVIGGDIVAFDKELADRLLGFAASPELPDWLAKKKAQLETDEATKPLEQYRAEELEKMKLNFYGFDPSYHIARHNFIRRVPKSRTPASLSNHRHVLPAKKPEVI